MKYYISFLLFGLLTLTFTSCNTDDLEKDIDALKDRVQSFEKQVQQLNDEMNIIRVALDGNKTIIDYSIDGDTYTLTLSNGEKLTLTPGVVGGNYPAIEIGENGNWVIGGKDTGIRAKALDGEDSTITPQFEIRSNPADGDKKYWYVSYDAGKTFTVLENGLAEGTNTSTNPISGAVISGDNLKVTFNNTDYLIPIIKSLVCAINQPTGMTDGFWMVAGGGESTFTAKVNLAEGDVVRVKAPLDWKAKLSGNTTGSTEVTITVTPPSTPSECVIVVEVTHGVNTAVDQLKAKTVSDSYWAEYQAGFDIKIGDVVVNRYDNPNAQLLQNGGKIAANGVYFIAAGAIVDWTGGTGNLIVLPEIKDGNGGMPSVGVAMGTVNGAVKFSGEPGDLGVLFREIKFFWKDIPAGYSFNTVNGKTTRRLVFERCIMEMPKDKSLSFLSGKGNIDDIVMESCRIAFPAPTVNSTVINFWNLEAGSYKNVTIHNNVFYCSDEGKSCAIVALMGKQFPTNVSIENNSFINILSNHGGSSGYVKVTLQDGWMFKNSLIWYNTEWVDKTVNANSHMVSLAALPVATFDGSTLASNKVFNGVTNSQLSWTYYRGTLPDGVSNVTITPSTDNPFSSITASEGKYTLKPEYQGIGATIE